MTTLTCPIPDNPLLGASVELKHGAGTKAMDELIDKIFRSAFGDTLQCETDAAILTLPPGYSRIAMTTDGHVVDPPFFPGGDIGALSVIGTVNDLVVSGAEPLWMSVAFVIPEGFPLADLHRIARSMGETARAIGVSIVTGDTKVLPKEDGRALMITTTGFGGVPEGRPLVTPKEIHKGDVVIVSGDLGRHFAAIVSARPEYGIASQVKSDMRPLHEEVHALFTQGIRVHCMRDLTRGGLTSGLCGIAGVAQAYILVREEAIPLHPAAEAICEQWGFDRFSRANEGRMVLFVPKEDATRTLDALADAGSRHACVIGEVLETGLPKGKVVMEMTSGVLRPMTLPSDKDVIRIC
jgi:hydrogenase expression/formation protein HypE